MNIDPEWLHVGLTLLIACIGAYQVWQNTNIKLAIKEVELTVANRIGEVKDWAHENFQRKISKTG